MALDYRLMTGKQYRVRRERSYNYSTVVVRSFSAHPVHMKMVKWKELHNTRTLRKSNNLFGTFDIDAKCATFQFHGKYVN